MHTQFSNAINPWTSQRMTKTAKPRKPDVRKNVEEISFTDDKPVGRVMPDGKYTPVFDRAYATGQRIKCPPESSQSISNAARKWVEKNSLAAKVSATSKYPKDGMGGVWIIPETAQ